jgi:hypothetical protein
MPRPMALATPDTARPLPFEAAMKLLFVRHGLGYISSSKETLKTNMVVSFCREENDCYTLSVSVPEWKDAEEHDDLFYDAVELKLKKWINVQRCRGFQKMAMEMFRMIPPDNFAAKLTEGKYERACGEVFCAICRQPYADHPEISGMPTFHVLCAGAIVKT